MKFKRLFLTTLVLFISILLFGFTDVYAVPTCKYSTTQPPVDNESYKTYTAIEVTYENGELKAKCTNDKAGLTCFITDADKNIPKELFIIEDDTLYCPSTLWISQHTGGGGVSWYYGLHASKSVAIAEAYGKKEQRVAPIEIEKVYSAKKYISGANGDVTLTACKLGGKNYYNQKISELENIKNTISNLKDDTSVKNINNRISAISKVDDTYCNKDRLNEFLELYTSVVTELREKVDELGKSNQINAETRRSFNEAMTEAESNIAPIYSRIGNINVPFNTDPNKFTCRGLIGEELLDLINLLLKIVQIAAPIIVIIMGSIDFGSVVISQDQDAMKKAVSKFIKRCIAAVAIFFIPFIVKLILNMDGISDWQSDDPTCGINEKVTE